MLRQIRRRIPDGPPYRIGVIRWDDTHPVEGWHEPAALDGDPCTMTSVAYVLPWGTKADHLTICQDVAPEGQVNGVTHLPLTIVRRVDFLT